MTGNFIWPVTRSFCRGVSGSPRLTGRPRAVAVATGENQAKLRGPRGVTCAGTRTPQPSPRRSTSGAPHGRITLQARGRHGKFRDPVGPCPGVPRPRPPGLWSPSSLSHSFLSPKKFPNGCELIQLLPLVTARGKGLTGTCHGVFVGPPVVHLGHAPPSSPSSPAAKSYTQQGFSPQQNFARLLVPPASDLTE